MVLSLCLTVLTVLHPFINRPKWQKVLFSAPRGVKRRGFIWEAISACFNSFEEKVSNPP